uniref:Reverse transcriptase domain-containing protein n=1 Tax=Lactuca sativa TaxID=4236 RepID=A0A9R1XGS7_LACSA|nr:hypothetical protein LSAT_V11C400169530 [Lactuca sativa]
MVEIRMVVWNCWTTNHRARTGSLSPSNFRPINLIGCITKIISKVLSERFKRVIGTVVIDKKSTYICDRSIRDGPFVVNERKKVILFRRSCSLSRYKVSKLLLTRLLTKNIFKVVTLPNNSPTVSVFQYADEAMLLGECSKENALNLIRILRFFHLACGESVGDNMNKTSTWSSLVSKFQSKLCNQKAQNLSFSGILTLCRSILGSLINLLFSLFKALLRLSTSSKTSAGHGIGSLHVLNLSFHGKTCWCFKNEDYSLWKL